MVGPVVDGAADVDQGIAGKDALAHGLLDALVDGGNEVAWHVAAHDLVHELVAGPGVGLDAQPAVTVLPGTSGLLLVAALGAGHTTDGLAIRDAELDGMCRHASPILETVEQNGHLRLADGADDGLTGVLVAADGERGIGIGGLFQEGEDLPLAAALVGLDGHTVERVGKAELCRLHLPRDGERVSGHGVKLGDDADVTRGHRLDVNHVVAGHQIEMAQAFGLAGTCVDELGTRGDGPRQHLDEGQLPVLSVLQRLEHEGDRSVVVGRDVKLLSVDQRHAPVISHGRKPPRHCAQKRDDALLVHARTREDRDEDAPDQRFAEKVLELLLSDGASVEVLHHRVVIGLDDEFDELGAHRLCDVAERRGDLLLDGLAVLKVTRCHVHHVDDPAELSARPHGHGHGDQAAAIALLGRQESGVPIRIRAVEAVDEEGTGYVEILGRIPQARGDGAGPRGGVHHKERGLGRGQGPVGIAHEVWIARCVEHVDAAATPRYRGDRGGDGEAARAFLAIVVKRGLGAGVPTKAGRPARQMEHGLGQHGLAHAALAHER